MASQGNQERLTPMIFGKTAQGLKLKDTDRNCEHEKQNAKKGKDAETKNSK